MRAIDRRERQRAKTVLVRHFFRQFFTNDSIPAGTEGYKTIVPVLAILTAPGLCIPLFWLLPIYLHLWRFPPETQLLIVAYHQFFFITLSMVVSCGIALLQWDRLFLMGRDRSILLPLPIRERDIYVSKFFALIAFVGTFTLAVNFFSMLLFPGVVFVRDAPLLGSAPRFLLGHIAGVFGGSLLAFLAVVACQGLLLALWRGKPRRALTFVQLGLLGVLTLVLSLYRLFFETWETVGENPSYTQILFPPFWFLGLARSVGGASGPAMGMLSGVACWGLAVVLTAVCVLQLAGSPRFAEAGEKPVHPVFRAERNWARLRVIRCWTKSSAELAVIFFVIKTLLKSSRHRLIMTGFLGVGLGLSLATLWKAASLVEPREVFQGLAAIPQILTFFLIVGLRVAFVEPAEPGANWLFQINFQIRSVTCLAGVKKLMVLLAMAPLVLLLPVFSYYGGVAIGVLKFGFSLLLVMVLLEVVLFRFDRIPFTSKYLPGSSNLKLFWAFYLIGFWIYAYSSSSLETWLLAVPSRAVFFEVVASLLLVAWVRFRRTRLERGVPLTFEPEDRDRLLSLQW